MTMLIEMVDPTLALMTSFTSPWYWIGLAAVAIGFTVLITGRGRSVASDAPLPGTEDRRGPHFREMNERWRRSFSFRHQGCPTSFRRRQQLRRMRVRGGA